ncbi:MgtC/SapB family protein [Chitinilyticum piscinae]|uniref:Protein MgtC n=1 Tax=Chitinilyticum piscinae TaxID=2866724 RepID=A0A8J7FHM8_9NEIS|nr:MgtC/SapB family protein [Chitinilyticum piscinae]MBE9609415.1 MgtC/SapB family protein [Chitinilyticum piscinae]
MPDLSALTVYWSPAELSSNLIMALHLLGSMLLGLLLGYERSYRGRAAGMRTYALVCMASTGLVVAVGYPQLWFGGQLASSHGLGGSFGDPTRVIQGIVSGLGFLCAGVIMREGFNISGLTTAASIWAASAIGILIGIGFYLSAIVLTLLCVSCMMWGARLEAWLPSRPAIAVTLRFSAQARVSEEELRAFAHAHGYDVASGSIHIDAGQALQEWHFVCVAVSKHAGSSLSHLAQVLPQFEGLQEYRLGHARN